MKGDRYRKFNSVSISSLEENKNQGCPECGGERVIQDYENAEVVCMECGIVLVAKITEKRAEWRAFTKQQREKRRRVGSPITYTIHDKGLSTMIDRRNRDAYGNRIPSGQKAQIYRLRKWHRRVKGSERSLSYALSEISKIANKLNLPRNILETASVIYRKAVKNKLIRGRSIKGVTAAVVYLSCRQCNLPRTLEEIATASNMNKKEVGRIYRFIIKKLDVHVPPVKPRQYVARFTNQLKTQGKVEGIAHKILTVAKKLRLTSGRGPTGMAAAATYMAVVLAGGVKTQRDIAGIAQVTEVTIRNRYKELMECLMFKISL